MKRFYREVAARPHAGAFSVELDGRPIKTPAAALLVVPNQPIAEAIAAEWQAQGDTVDPASMPLTAIACTAIDVVGRQRERVVDEIVAYAGHDLLCYWAEGPSDLIARQRVTWQPLLDWAALTFDAPLTVTQGILSVPQPPATLAALRGTIDATDDLTLAAVSSAVTAAGSVIVALALRDGRLGAEEAYAAAQLDELYQAERWGEDREAAKRRAGIRRDLEAAARLFALANA